MIGEKRAMLILAAKNACSNSYSPYSHFKVGAAVLCDGKIYTGTNIENASYSMTICAERCAVFSAVADGARNIDGIAVYHDGNELPYPCGACLQVIAEFCDDTDVYVVSETESVDTKLSQLLPSKFVLKK